MTRLAVAAVLVCLCAAMPARAGEQTVTLQVDNMTCGACPYIVREALAAVPGVSTVDVSFAAKTAIVTFDDQRTSADALATAATNSGFPARPASATE